MSGSGALEPSLGSFPSSAELEPILRKSYLAGCSRCGRLVPSMIRRARHAPASPEASPGMPPERRRWRMYERVNGREAYSGSFGARLANAHCTEFAPSSRRSAQRMPPCFRLQLKFKLTDACLLVSTATSHQIADKRRAARGYILASGIAPSSRADARISGTPNASRARARIVRLAGKRIFPSQFSCTGNSLQRTH